jgi:aryl-alcohol dehydrogenase
MQIKAAVARAKSAPLSLEMLQIEPPRKDEILVRILASGICHTDLAMRDQVFPVPQPIVLGHEGAGVVAAIGSDVADFAVGDHVVMSFNCCGDCWPCKSGQSSYCAKSFPLNFGGSRLDGSTSLRQGEEKIHSHFFGQSSFAEYAICNRRNAVHVPHELPFELLAPLGCGVMTGAGAVLNAFKLAPGKSLIVFGSGNVGLSAIMAAHASKAGAIVAVDLFESRLAMAKELGATHVINAREGNVEKAVRAAVPDGLDFALDTTARPDVIATAMACLGSRGTCGLLGASHPTETLSLNLIDTMSYGKSVRGIIEGDATPATFIPKLIELYRQGLFPFDRLIKCYRFENINEAIHDSETGKVIKAVVRMA